MEAGSSLIDIKIGADQKIDGAADDLAGAVAYDVGDHVGHPFHIGRDGGHFIGREHYCPEVGDVGGLR
jgi:hypothetical protein